MKIVKRIAVLLVLCLCLTGCGGKPVPSTTHRVALVAKSTQTEFWKSVFAGAKAAAAEYNVDLTICGPEKEEDYGTQNSLVDLVVADGAEALVFSAISYTENAEAIDRAAAAGVKVVVIDSDVASDKVSVHIGTDNIDAGRKAAHAALDTKLEKLVIGIVNYDAGSRNGQEREKGFREVCSQDRRVAGIYTINVLAEQDNARERTVDLLTRHPEINVLVALNEPTAVGAALAIEDLGLTGKIHMVGFDSNIRTVDQMQEGTVSALVVQNTYAMGYLGVEAAWGLLNGQTYDANKLMDTSTTIVTRSNMFEIEKQKILFPFY